MALRPEKICMLSTGHGPLDDRIYYKEALSLAKQYKNIILAMPGDASDFTSKESGMKFIPLKKGRSLFSRFLVLPQALFTVMKVRPQVCHFHDYELIFAMPFIKLLYGCKIIYDVHEVYPEMALESKNVPFFLRPLFAMVVKVCERLLSPLAHHIITADESIKVRLRSAHRKITTIYNYPRLSVFVPDKLKLMQLEQRYSGRTPIIYQGGISEQRGLFLMIDAMEILKKKRPDVVLLIVGKMGDYLFKKTNDKLESQNLSDVVEVIGWVPHVDVVNYILIAKLGIIPFLPTKKFMKNIPVKQFEYMACGVPVLGADLPPIASYVNSARCGKVFDSTNPEALVAGVIEILQDDIEWKRMSEAGKKAVEELWNWDEMEKRLFAVYEEILKA